MWSKTGGQQVPIYSQCLATALGGSSLVSVSPHKTRELENQRRSMTGAVRCSVKDRLHTCIRMDTVDMRAQTQKSSQTLDTEKPCEHGVHCAATIPRCSVLPLSPSSPLEKELCLAPSLVLA
ncbi:hypothetical protein U9M48_026811 [Paspalum notatum var. saurae]|uniref:Uncharacterized protein n=1 Tax=Paspalum notatum var. saurae TaxID=547442 RepID=A0AAQ3TXG6_PASNO